MAPAEVLSFILYAVIMVRPLSGLIGFWGQLNLAEGSFSRLLDVWDMTPEQYIGGQQVEPIRGQIRFENVTFHYPDRQTVLSDLSLTIEPHEVIALSGPNGAGKSTLIKLLMRFYTPNSGRIALDDKDISLLNLRSLRSAIGWVTQSPLLFEDSLLANLKFGNAHATEGDIQNVIRLAQLGALIDRCQDGLQTRIGEQGVKLSGGEKQRIALARAILKDPKILILDEPTAMFDPDSEAQFIADMTTVCKDRTVILVSHRPLSLTLANRVFRCGFDGLSELNMRDIAS